MRKTPFIFRNETSFKKCNNKLQISNKIWPVYFFNGFYFSII